MIPSKGVKKTNNFEGSELSDREESNWDDGESDDEDEDQNPLFDIDPDKEIPIEVTEEI